MASIQQMTGMRGVYLVAAELSRLGFIASPTSRSAIGADILVTDQSCKNAFSIQVKTNRKKAGFWLVGKKAKELVSESHVYSLVNLRPDLDPEIPDYYIVPSKVVAEKLVHDKNRRSEWYSVFVKDVATYKDAWSILGGS